MHASHDWPLGLAHFTCIGVPPVDLVRLAGRTGCASVGLRLYPAFPGAPFYALPPGSDAFREMRRALADEGMRVYDIEFVTLGEDFVPASLAGILEAAAGLGARRLSVCGDDPDRPRLVARFAELCDLAAGFGMGVDLECMAWRQVASLPDAVRVVEAAGRPNGGVLVDALHLSRTGGSPDDVRAVPPGLVRHAQLCDAPAQVPGSTAAIIQEARAGRLSPGDGALPLAALVAALPPRAVLSIEVPITGTVSPEAHIQANLAAARRLLAD
ncbi:sugar phosphate isomerase [Methylobacterium tarhaniae]|uniref:Sugar phosphate isomerase n=1 Tax=Methylobacterium tarhaniae TaxID=1187852 RepID=A0A0J6T780_9HYPH|nr:TIM barrel protein [Methylobacterium tarhaniae]KMO41742.1 sugar phosphate isomerase [Methylobacterium tarhaniae]